MLPPTLIPAVSTPATDDDSHLVETHLGLADHLAGRYCGRGVDRDDLVQVARLALVRCAQTFDPAQGAFAPFATATIRGELKKYFRDLAWSVRPPRRVQELQAAVRADLAEHPEASDDDVAARLQVGRDDVREARGASGCFAPDSLDRTVPGTTLRLVDSMGADDPDLEQVELWQTFRSLNRDLTDDERTLLHLRYVQEQSQQQIADRLGVSQMQVSRRLRRLLDHLRSAAQVPA